jgi:alcohol dehydrogenase
MNEQKLRAAALLHEFKGENFVFGLGCFGELGHLAAEYGRRVSVVTSGVGKPWGRPIHEATQAALARAGLELAGELIQGAAPNSPFDDVLRLAKTLSEQNPEVVVCVGGGSGIDATKAALCYLALGDKHPDLYEYFGVGVLSKLLRQEERRLLPLVAVQLAAGSAAHLTRYSNITDMRTSQKMLIIDDAAIPPKAVFDYAMTASMSREFTLDGAFDGLAHCLESYLGSKGEKLARQEEVSLLGIELIVNHVGAACRNPGDLAAREGIGLGTDLSGYAIMIGSTSGPHLNSFSLVDLLPHGRACALLTPYYTVFFAPAVEAKLRKVGAIYRKAGYLTEDLDALSGRELGLAVARAMVALCREVGFPTTLNQVKGFNDEYIDRCLQAAKNPALSSKLQAMPVQLTVSEIDEYMGSVLAAATNGDFSLIKTHP